MSTITRAFKTFLVPVVLLTNLYTVPVVSAEALPPQVLITELQTGSTESASDEFVELVNVSAAAIDMSAWVLQYKSSSGTSWSTKVNLGGIMEPGDRFLVASSVYTAATPDFQFSAGFAAAGGHIRIAYPDAANPGQLLQTDLLGWGTAVAPEGVAAAAPAAGKSLSRLTDLADKFVDTDVNNADFAVNETPFAENTPISAYISVETPPDSSSTPQEEDQASPTPETDTGTGGQSDTSGPTGQTDPASGTQNSETQETAHETIPEAVQENEQQAGVEAEQEQVVYVPILLSELFVDPPSPQTDAADEYIELYNPSSTAVSLDGYQLHTGSTFSHHYVIGDITIQPGQYLALRSSLTKLSLSNSGGAARIVMPDGGVSDMVEYEAAKVNTAWALVNGEWQWTTVVTPDAANEPTPPKVEAAAAAQTLKNTVKKAAAKKPAAAKKTAAKTVTAKTTKKTTKTAASGGSGASEDEAEPAVRRSLNIPILAGVGSLALLYAVYEYRKDLANRIYQLRRYAANRRATRSQVEGR